MKIIKKFLIIISIIIIIIGLILAIGTTNELQNELSKNDVYIDGSNFSEIIQTFGQFGSVIVGVIIFFYSIVIDVILWIIYGIVIVISKFIKKEAKKNIN